MKKTIIINYKKKRLKIVAEDCNLLKKFTGLMFSRRQNSRALLFSFGKKGKIAIHSFFVFYPFAAVWIDGRNNVADIKIVRPFSPYISPKKSGFGLVEIPLNDYYSKILKILL